jgi:acetyltransferase-like isoleucine patch superfamily enzyme
MAFLNNNGLTEIGFASLGENVWISDKASIYGAERIRIGSNVRIDDFCILSAGEGGISIGNHVHIGAAATLIGKGAITLDDFCNLSGRVSIYSSSDDYSGAGMTNPMVPDQYKRVCDDAVHLGRHVIVGCASVILPGSNLREGCAVGALSMVGSDWPPFTILAGVPARRLRDRRRDLLALEREFLAGRRGER